MMQNAKRKTMRCWQHGIIPLFLTKKNFQPPIFNPENRFTFQFSTLKNVLPILTPQFSTLKIVLPKFFEFLKFMSAFHMIKHCMDQQ